MPSHDKLTTADEAVRRFVKPGSCVCLSGFTVNRNPMALAHEIIRQGIDRLHIVMHSGGQALDLLIGAGLVELVEIAYGANGRFASTCTRFRKAAETGSIKVEDYSNYQMTLRFMAGAMGVPFLPTFSSLGTDILERWGFDHELRAQHPSLPRMKLVVTDDPFSSVGGPMVLVPAVNPDVCLLHAQKASPEGTVRVEGLTFADAEQARASKAVVVTCEDVVSDEELRKEPWHNTIPSVLVDAVIHQPYGAHPTACYLHYDYDDKHLLEYNEMAADDVAFKEYLAKYVLNPGSFNGYIEILGNDRLNNIRASPGLGYHRRDET